MRVAGGRGKVPGQRPYQPPPHQVVANGFDGTRFVNAGRAMGPVFHGHDLLDQPEHSAGCPATPILGGWAGEGERGCLDNGIRVIDAQ